MCLGALALPGTNINEFLGDYDSSWGAKPPITTPAYECDLFNLI